MHTRTRTHMHTCTHTHTCIHTHMHTHNHIPTCNMVTSQLGSQTNNHLISCLSCMLWHQPHILLRDDLVKAVEQNRCSLCQECVTGPLTHVMEELGPKQPQTKVGLCSKQALKHQLQEMTTGYTQGRSKNKCTFKLHTTPYHKVTGPTHYYMVEHVQIFNYEVLQKLHLLTQGTHSLFHWYIILYRYVHLLR